MRLTLKRIGTNIIKLRGRRKKNDVFEFVKFICLDDLSKKVEGLKIRLAELHKEKRLMELKIKERQRKSRLQVYFIINIVNMKQKLQPLSGTPLPSSSSKMSENLQNRFAHKNPTHRSVAALKSIKYQQKSVTKRYNGSEDRTFDTNNDLKILN